MPKTKGTVDDVQPRDKDGNKYLILKIDGKKFYLHDNDKFSNAQEGDTVNVEFNKNESGDKIFRNIQEIDSIEKSSSGDGTAPGWEKRARALELGIQYVSNIDGDKKVSETADMFLDYMDD